VGPGVLGGDPPSPVPFPDGGLLFDGLDLHVGDGGTSAVGQRS